MVVSYCAVGHGEKPGLGFFAFLASLTREEMDYCCEKETGFQENTQEFAGSTVCSYQVRKGFNTPLLN